MDLEILVTSTAGPWKVGEHGEKLVWGKREEKNDRTMIHAIS
jgi:hypothetical protein